MEIEFYTNSELISELIKRKTFVGVVIAAEDARTIENDEVNFKLYSNGFDPQATKILLKCLAKEI